MKRTSALKAITGERTTAKGTIERRRPPALAVGRMANPTERSRLNHEYTIAVEWLVEASLRSCELSRFPCDDYVLQISEDEVEAALAACNLTRQAVQDYAIQPKAQKKSAAHG